MNDYYDINGKPMSMEEWIEAFSSREERRIGLDEVGESKVSTVHLGLNHNWREGFAPLIFETMIFDGPHDQWQARYATKERAEKGHKATIAWLLHEGPEPDGDYGLSYDDWHKEVHGGVLPT